jgi:NAD(P)-dependent dehydrogenase (short-subunit alcohol dehydrogenase family)
MFENLFRLDGKIAVVTGAANGLGRSFALGLAAFGANVICADRNLEGADETASLAKQSRGKAEATHVDVADEASVDGMWKTIAENYGRIDILINNAGIIEVGPVENQPIAAYRRAMATNFFAALHTTHAALPHLLRRNPIRGDAAIVNIASVGGKFAVPHMLPYVASKFALVGFSEGLHAELRHKGIRVTTVCPGLMRTGGEAHADYTGQTKKEQRWFNLAARTPVLATSVRHAANKIYNAVAAGRGEITITPQAWLAARAAGLAPETTQYLASLANHLLLPAPSPSDQLNLGFTLKVSAYTEREIFEQKISPEPN